MNKCCVFSYRPIVLKNKLLTMQQKVLKIQGFDHERKINVATLKTHRIAIELNCFKLRL